MTSEEFKIDKETGLPEVPDNHFWRVSSYRTYHDFFNTRPDEEGPCVILVRRDKIKRSFPKPVGVFGEFLNSIFNIKTEKIEIEEETEVNVEFELIKHPKSNKVIKFEEITSEGIKAACIRLLQRVESRKRAEDLLGDYPPKKLEN